MRGIKTPRIVQNHPRGIAETTVAVKGARIGDDVRIFSRKTFEMSNKQNRLLANAVHQESEDVSLTDRRAGSKSERTVRLH